MPVISPVIIMKRPVLFMKKLFFLLKLNKLRNQLLAACITICLCIIVLGFGMVYTSVLGMLNDLSAEINHQNLRQVETNIQVFLEKIGVTANTITFDRNVQQFLLGHDSHLESILYFTNFHKDVSRINHIAGIAAVTIVKPNGEIWSVSTTNHLNVTRENKNDFRVLQGEAAALVDIATSSQAVFGGFNANDFRVLEQLSPTPDENPVRFITIVNRIYHLHSTTVSAVMIINVPESEFNQSYKELVVNGSNFYVLNADGMIISSLQAERIGQYYDMFPEITGAAVNNISHRRNGEDIQIVFNRTQVQDLYLVMEIPRSHYAQNIHRLNRIIVLTLLLSVALIAFFYVLTANRLTRPFRTLLSAMRKMGEGRLGIQIDRQLNNEIGEIIDQFNYMSENIQTLITKNVAFEKDKRVMEIEILQNQISPHFLYNSLNNIRWMARFVGAENIAECITSLADMLRSAFNNRELFHTISSEIEYLTNYVTLINYRQIDNVTLDVKVPADIHDNKLLKFLTQPIVENAIKHGMEDQGEITVTVEIYTESGDLCIRIQDDGVGIDPARREQINSHLAGIEAGADLKMGIGLTNVNKRIKLFYGEGYGLKFVPVEKGACVLVNLPMHGEETMVMGAGVSTRA